VQAEAEMTCGAVAHGRASASGGSARRSEPRRSARGSGACG
jgi:hypothetical protein